MLFLKNVILKTSSSEDLIKNMFFEMDDLEQTNKKLDSIKVSHGETSRSWMIKMSHIFEFLSSQHL